MNPKSRDPLLRPVVFLVVTAVGLLPLAYGAILHEVSEHHFYILSQEDGYLEWGTFWSFALAACIAIGVAIARRSPGRIPQWFFLCVSGFAFFVAMEEISWGYRLFRFDPPEYFLAHNYQQEPNLHNIWSSSFRRIAKSLLVIGYGVLLPLVGLVSRSARALARLGVQPPPAALIPMSVVTFVFAQWRPWDFVGEWIEFQLGLSLLFGVVAALPGLVRTPARTYLHYVFASWVAVLVMGVATSFAMDRVRGDQATEVERAKVEAERLAERFESLPDPCQRKSSLHKRVFTYRQEYEGDEFGRGSDGAVDARAKYYLDPWNLPYWVRCPDVGPHAYVYSFGPNRRRDGSDATMMVGGDDIVVSFSKWDGLPRVVTEASGKPESTGDGSSGESDWGEW